MSRPERTLLGKTVTRVSNSSMVTYSILSPNNSGQRTHAIDRITPHCVEGQSSIEALGARFAAPATKASSNYGIDKDGRIGLFVPEDWRSWCSSSRENDQRAVTIECASDNFAPYAFRDIVYQRLVELCVDICRRNGKRRLLWLADKEKTLAYEPAADEMLLSVHRWFENKACPGEWLFSRLGELAETVTAALDPPEITFSDVPPDAWFADTVRWAVDRGIAQGFPDGTFQPNKPATRAEVLTFLRRQADMS